MEELITKYLKHCAEKGADGSYRQQNSTEKGAVISQNSALTNQKGAERGANGGAPDGAVISQNSAENSASAGVK